jgi:hypothetical protein
MRSDVSAALVAAHRSPAAAARRGSGRTAAERDRSRTADQQHAGAVAEGVVERDAEVGVDHELRCEVATDERLPQLISLRLAAGARDADAQHAWRHVRHVARGQGVSHDVADDVRGFLGSAGAHRAAGTDRLGDRASVFVGHHGVGLRPAAVDSNDDEVHPVSATAG